MLLLSGSSRSASEIKPCHDDQSPDDNSKRLLPAEARMTKTQGIGERSDEYEENTTATTIHARTEFCMDTPLPLYWMTSSVRSGSCQVE